jgi:hypothetical protein
MCGRLAANAQGRQRLRPWASVCWFGVVKVAFAPSSYTHFLPVTAPLGHDTLVFNMPYEEKPKGMKSTSHQYHSSMRGASWVDKEDDNASKPKA